MSNFTPKLFTVIKEGYSAHDLTKDLMAGLTVAIVALPLAMALAIASGASPEQGLITAVIAGFIISFLGGSRVQIGGPTGAFVVVVYNIISTHGYGGLVIATIMAGVILIIAGYAKLGQIIKFIPHPVITGFTAGIAVIIASSQVKDFLGLEIQALPAEFIAKWLAYFEAIDTVHLTTLAVGLCALFIIIGLHRYLPKLPGYLIAVLITSIAVTILHMPVETIGSRFPTISGGLPALQIPTINIETILKLAPSAFTIAFLAGIEALLSATVADSMTGYKHRSNQELIGQGIANIASPLFGGLPATGAIARTATNIRSGGKSPMAGIFHALFLLIFMLYFMDTIKYIPMASLAAILFVVAWGMSEARHFIHIFSLSKSDRIVMILTFLLTVLVDLTVGIAVGVTLACLLFIKHMKEAVEVKPKWRSVDINQRQDLPESVEVFQINGPFFFAVAGDLIETLKNIGSTPKVLILRMRTVPYLDATGEKALEAIIQQCSNNGTKIILSGLQTQPLQMITNAKLQNNSNVTLCKDYSNALKVAGEMVEDKV